MAASQPNPHPHSGGPDLNGRGGSSRPAAFVQKLRVPVRVSQPQSQPRDGSLLLFPHIGRATRPETLVELLNSPRTVIPFVPAPDDEVLLLSRRNIDWVAVSDDVPAELVVPPGAPATHEHRAELRFLDESRVEVRIRWASPDSTVRVSDHLNAHAEFIVVEAGFGVLIVNARRIRETRLIGAPARLA